MDRSKHEARATMADKRLLWSPLTPHDPVSSTPAERAVALVALVSASSPSVLSQLSLTALPAAGRPKPTKNGAAPCSR